MNVYSGYVGEEETKKVPKVVDSEYFLLVTSELKLHLDRNMVPLVPTSEILIQSAFLRSLESVLLRTLLTVWCSRCLGNGASLGGLGLRM